MGSTSSATPGFEPTEYDLSEEGQDERRIREWVEQYGPTLTVELVKELSDKNDRGEELTTVEAHQLSVAWILSDPQPADDGEYWATWTEIPVWKTVHRYAPPTSSSSRVLHLRPTVRTRPVRTRPRGFRTTRRRTAGTSRGDPHEPGDDDLARPGGCFALVRSRA